ncbi:DNA repair protein RadA [Candidatus Gottesmanbacteria bacterium RIFOXYB1_FULL_47_11]|uniref:DNA repair protein RadA n=1 Tax=Candidatus Gottesmanbacteria bacterium RIFOXYB1_FULL_47_11 TaxID=1798401 RepID=A0A1F6BG71_9BACT|nr:MAG: DNA repair protein RadA [Candidatus Gottesmanbacteria bacterium RIFOXYB1_FULL_47_11]
MKLRTSFICQQCAFESLSWYGKCPNCGVWNTLVETVKEDARQSVNASMRQRTGAVKPQKLSEVRHIEKNRLKSGFAEFDRVMGGGVVPGSVTLLAGDPGIGKSTLTLHVLAAVGGLYVSGEESAEQIKLRAKRLGIGGENVSILSEISVESIVSNVSEKKLVIIDSIQTLMSSDLDGMAGSVGQIRHCAEVLIAAAKTKGIPIMIIGHVTREGTIAGPKVLEHMVDTVLYLEGERFANARILRTLKNRFGAVEEVGIFEMDDKGLREISNPSALFLQDRVKNVPGSIVTVVMEGTRPMLVEIQALTVASQLAMPRRIGNGIDYNRLQLVIAILSKRLNVPLGGFDIFVNVSGGMRVSEPSADLAIALAILSSFKNKALDPKTAVFGEVGLLGEVRSIGSDERRTKEARRLGFTTIISPKTVRNLLQAGKFLLL